MSSDSKKIAQKIRKLREKLNLSQDRFGKKIGLSGKSISAYESGRCVPSLKILEKISQVYDAGFVAMADIHKRSILDKLQDFKKLIGELEAKMF